MIKPKAAVCGMLIFALCYLLTGCGGGGGGSSNPGPQSVNGVSTPSNVSVVTAQNAGD